MVTRRARRPSLLCVLALFGCNQSLFDSNPNNRDGGPGDRDSGPDDGDGSPPVSSCPEPCAGDAVADFSGEQGGTSGAWYYLADLGAANGADYGALDFGVWDGITAWTAGADGPAIASCAGEPAAACAGLEGFVLLVPGTGGARPALAFRAPETATYQLTGAARVADGEAADVPIQLLVSRAGRHDAIVVQTVRTSQTEVGIAAVVPALEGDEVIVSIGADSAIPPLGVRLFYTRVDEGADVFPARCQLALRFDGDTLTEGCRGAEIGDLNDGIGPAGMTTSGPGPSDRLGEARVFHEGQYLRLGNSPLDYSGDFTIQFWARITEPQPSFGVGLYADWNTVVKGGVAFFVDDDSDLVDFCYMAHGAEEIEDCTATSRAMDGQWHFWRSTRAGGTYRLCIDGAERVQVPIPAGLNMTSDEPPRLGRNVVYNPAYFDGSIDEVRVFAEALPCSTVIP